MKNLTLTIFLIVLIGCATYRPHTASELELLNELGVSIATEAATTSIMLCNQTEASQVDPSFTIGKAGVYLTIFPSLGSILTVS